MRKDHLFSSCIVLLLIVAFHSTLFSQINVLNIGSRRELFLDDYLIESTNGSVELRLHKPVMREVVMVHDAPWEGNTCGYHVVLRDGDQYRMYYRGSHTPFAEREVRSPVTCCAISCDGIHWKRPHFGIFEFEGSTDNNIIWKGRGSHNFEPFIDNNPACISEQKYKAVGGIRREKGLYTFSSPDGIHWKSMSDTPMISDFYSLDGDNRVFWDAVDQEYRCYFRHRQDGKRAFMTCTSKDFLQWSEPVFLEYPDRDPVEIYTNMVTPYLNAPHIYIGFPARYQKFRGEIVESLFMSSRDGVSFNRWEEAIIRPGLNHERWLNRSNYIWHGIVTTSSDLPGGPDEMSIYSNERYYTDKGAKTRRFTYRMDGFVSIHASFSGGEMITKPFTFNGKQLNLNFSTSAAGTIMIEIQNRAGMPISGFTHAVSPELYGDYTDYIVTWPTGADLKALEGTPVRLRFILKDADLFSMQFQE